jgi:hypothetical protein
MNPSDASQDDAIPPPINPRYWQLALKQSMSTTEEECSGGEPGTGSKGEGRELSNSVVYGLSQPTIMGERQKSIYGTDNATRKARYQWLIRAADVIRFGPCPQVEPIYRNIARKNRTYEELQRAILALDIKVRLLIRSLVI